VYIKPEITPAKAEQILLTKSKSFLKKIERFASSLKRTEILYLPYYLVEMEVLHNTNTRHILLTVDALLGNSFMFTSEQLVFLPEANHEQCEFGLDLNTAREIAINEYKWLLFPHGFRRRKKIELKKITSIKQIYYPYWIGYFKTRKGYDFKAVDGISGEIQGIRMRKVFLKAFRNNAMEKTGKW